MGPTDPNNSQQIDDKWRMTIPPMHRGRVDSPCWIFWDPDDQYTLISDKRYQKMLDQFQRQVAMGEDSPKMELGADRLLNYSAQVTLDANHRFVVPAAMRGLTDIAPGTDITFVGRLNGVTIVSLQTYREKFSERLRSQDAKAAQAQILRTA